MNSTCEDIIFPLKKRSIKSLVRGFLYYLSSSIQRSASNFKLPQIGLTISVPRRSTFAWKLAKYGAYEPKHTNWLLHNIHPNMDSQTNGIIVDVGANFGWYSCVLGKSFPCLTVISIEPEPATFALLEKNISSSECKNIYAIQSGAGAESGVMDLYVSGGDNSGLHSAIPIKDFGDVVKVKIAKLDDLLATFPGIVELLKIDVEGFELSVINGAEKTLRRTRKIMLEFTPHCLEKLGFDPKDLLLKIQSFGFSIYFLNDCNLLVPVSIENCLKESKSIEQWQKDLICINKALAT